MRETAIGKIEIIGIAEVALAKSKDRSMPTLADALIAHRVGSDKREGSGTGRNDGGETILLADLIKDRHIDTAALADDIFFAPVLGVIQGPVVQRQMA